MLTTKSGELVAKAFEREMSVDVLRGGTWGKRRVVQLRKKHHDRISVEPGGNEKRGGASSHQKQKKKVGRNIPERVEKMRKRRLRGHAGGV